MNELGRDGLLTKENKMFDPMDKTRLRWLPQKKSTRETVVALMIILVFIMAAIALAYDAMVLDRQRQDFEIAPTAAYVEPVQTAEVQKSSPSSPVFIE